MNLRLDFYGIGVEVICSNTRIIHDIQRDFSYFVIDSKIAGPNKVCIEIFLESPPYHKIPKGTRPTFSTKDSINYDICGLRLSNFLGKALTVYDFSNETGRIYSEDMSVLHERAYLLILSRVGELLDRKEVHRVHALGIALDKKAVLCVLPMEGGKTALGLELLKHEGIKLISDEIPLMTREGKILPFPLRIGVVGGTSPEIPSRHLRVFNRSQHKPKTLIDIEYFEGKISGFCDPYLVLVGQRNSSHRARLEQVSLARAMLTLAMNSVWGQGLPHTYSYFLRRNIKGIFRYFRILLSRAVTSYGILKKSERYYFHMGEGAAINANYLAGFLHDELARR